MRIMIAVLAVASCHGQALFRAQNVTASGGGLNGFTHARPLVIDHTKVPSGQSSFTVLVSQTIAGLKATGSGGYVTDAQGDDISFTSDSGCATPLSWDPLETWSATTGAIVAWVKIASISSSVDTTFYICYGKASQTTFQGGSMGAAWDTNYKLVSHLPNGSSLTVLDSTSGGHNGTNTSATATAGQIDGAAAFGGSAYVDYAQAAISGATSATFSFWLNTSVVMTRQVLLASGLGVCGSNGFADIETVGNNHVRMLTDSGATPESAQNVTDGSWHFITGIYTPTTASIQVDNNSPTVTTGLTNAAIGSSATLEFGSYCSGSALFLTGAMDELRISNSARTADWITSEYNNQSSPGTFITVGAEL